MCVGSRLCVLCTRFVRSANEASIHSVRHSGTPANDIPRLIHIYTIGRSKHVFKNKKKEKKKHCDANSSAQRYEMKKMNKNYIVFMNAIQWQVAAVSSHVANWILISETCVHLGLVSRRRMQMCVADESVLFLSNEWFGRFKCRVWPAEELVIFHPNFSNM